MDRISVELLAIAELIRTVKPTEAELRFRQLVATLSAHEMDLYIDEIIE